MKVRFFLLIILILLPTLQARGGISDFIEENYTFRIKETADYTNHLDDNMLISVEGNREIAYSFVDYGEDESYNHWISGVLQVEVGNEVSIGKLNYSGFDAESGGRKSASISSFNMTLIDPANYSTHITPISMPFVNTRGTNVTLVDNTTIPNVFIGLDQPNFVIDEESWAEALETYFLNYVSHIESETELTATVDHGTRSFSYSVEGQMADVCTFTYHDRTIHTSADYNLIDITGGFSISYDENGALNDYKAEYEIRYGDIRIMQYIYTVSSGSGSIGNIQVGDAGFFPSFDLPITLLALVIIIPVISMVRRRKS
jgi:hypothetical protein